MAEATLDSNQQALAPAGGGQVAARTNVPAAPAAAGGLMDNTGQDTMDDIGVDGGPLSLLNNPDVQRILPYVIGVIALAICILFYLWALSWICGCVCTCNRVRFMFRITVSYWNHVHVYFW